MEAKAWLSRTKFLALVSAILTTSGGLAVQAQTKAAPADVLVELNIKNPDDFAEYGEKVPATISQHGGAVIANDIAEAIEGAPPEGRVIIIQFASVADAQG